MHARVAARMTTPVVVEAVRDAQTSARLARGAALVVTSRYHPAVFAGALGVPTIGIAVDAYTAVKLTGALGNVGQRTVVTDDDVVVCTALAAALRAWHEAALIRSAGAAALADRVAAKERWWDRVVLALGAVHDAENS